MVNNLFIAVDLSLLILLLISLISFLIKNKKNLSREGTLYLYKTSWGIDLINKIGKKYKNILGFLSYISVIVGYLLMIAIVYLLGSQTFQYLTNPAIVQAIKAPPIAPLIPYFPQLFGLDGLFPPFYAIYFIISILIVATMHEFSHGVFARKWGVKIKSTGFAFFKFFPVFFGAFVEQDDKQLVRKSKFKQMSILSAGVFANVLTAIFFLIVLAIFFSLVFVPSGIVFNDYSYSIVPVAGITAVNNVSLSNPAADEIILLMKNNSINEINAGEARYLGVKAFSNNKSLVALYDDAPALKNNLSSIILEINGKKISSLEVFREELSKYSPGKRITVKTKGENIKETEIVLGKNPANESLPFLGVVVPTSSKSNGILRNISALLFFKNSSTYYESNIGVAGEFIYYLLWWIFLINILVGLFNMLPLGILDGGRFFYLTILGIAKNEKIAKKIHFLVTSLIFMMFLLMMIRWVFSLF